MSYKIEQLTKDKIKEWDDFCFLSDDAWFWHTSGWLEYSLKYNPKLKADSKSFMVYNNSELIAICPLILQVNNQGIKEFCYNNEHGPMPAFSNLLSKKAKEKAMKAVYNHIDEIAGENNIKRAMFRFTVLSKSFIDAPRQTPNYLMRFGYLDNSIHTQIIDLKKDEEELKKDIRRNHRRSVRKASQFKFKIYDDRNISREVFNNYKETHHKAAGRKTRPDETFEWMYNQFENKSAILSVVEDGKKQIGFEYYSIYKNSVYGFSAANDPEYEEKYPIRQLIEWETILWMKRQGYDFYEIGWQQFGLQLYDMPTDKQINISEFKRGFGGFTVPWLRGEKFYDKNYFLEIQEDRIKKYVEHCNTQHSITNQHPIINIQ